MKRKMLAFIIICMVLSFGAGLAVSASSLLERISAYLNKEIKMTLQGSPWEAKVEGDILYPITYEGSTYLPVRAVAEALQVPIRWDQKTKTVHIAEVLEDKAAYAGSVEVLFIPAGESGGERENGTGSTQFIPESDGRLTMVLSGSIRKEGDTGFSITGTRNNGGWSINDSVELKIDGKGKISGEGVVSPYQMRFDGQVTSETLQLRIEQEQIERDESSGLPAGARFIYDYDLKRVAPAPPSVNEDNGGTTVEMPNDSPPVGGCSRIKWRFQHIANLSGGPMQMIQVPECVK